MTIRQGIYFTSRCGCGWRCTAVNTEEQAAREFDLHKCFTPEQTEIINRKAPEGIEWRQ